MSEPDIGLGLDSARRQALALPNGSTLGYWTAGHSGPALVCVNAHGQDLLVFSRLVQELAGSHRVIAWKPRGTYEQECVGHTVADQVRDLASILEQEGVRECSLVTWCSGAKIALEYASTKRTVRSLVLVSGTFAKIPGLETLETQFERTVCDLCRSVVKNPAVSRIMMQAMRSLLSGKTFRNAAADSGGNGHARDEALNALVLEPFQSPETTLCYAKQAVDYFDHDISRILDTLDVPVLVVSGEKDEVSSSAMARVVADRLAHARYVEIPGGSHYCLYDRFELIGRAVLEFLSEGSLRNSA